MILSIATSVISVITLYSNSVAENNDTVSNNGKNNFANKNGTGENTDDILLHVMHFTNLVVLVAILLLWIYKNMKENKYIHNYVFIVVFMVYGSLIMSLIEIYQQKHNRSFNIMRKNINYTMIVIQTLMMILLIFNQYQYNYYYGKDSSNLRTIQGVQSHFEKQMQLQYGSEEEEYEDDDEKLQMETNILPRSRTNEPVSSLITPTKKQKQLHRQGRKRSRQSYISGQHSATIQTPLQRKKVKTMQPPSSSFSTTLRKIDEDTSLSPENTLSTVKRFSLKNTFSPYTPLSKTQSRINADPENWSISKFVSPIPPQKKFQ